MFTKRERDILIILKKESPGITSEEIGKLLGVSSKTVRTTIRSIIDTLPAEIATISSSNRYGYSLRVKNDKSLDLLLMANEQVSNEEEIRLPIVITELFWGTFNSEPVRQQDIADSLFIGLTTAKVLLREVKAFIAPYNLELINYKNQGMMLVGDELELRRALVEVVMSPTTREYMLPRLNAVEYSYELHNILLRVVTSYDIVFTDNSLKRLVAVLLTSVYRSKRGHKLTFMLSESKVLEESREFALAATVYDVVYKELGIDVDLGERYYLAQHLIASRRYSGPDTVASQYSQELTDSILLRIYELVGIDFRSDDVLKRGLRLHLETVIPRIRFQVNTKNEILNVVKNDYPLAFQLGVIASKVIEKRENGLVSADEIGFLAVHFGAALTRLNIYSDSLGKSVVIVCGSSMGTAVLLKERLQEVFKDMLTVTKILPGYQLKTEDMNEADVIISTLPLKEFKDLSEDTLGKLVIVSNLLDEEDLRIVRQKVFHTVPLRAERFFRRECFVTECSFYDRNAVLEFMTTSLVRLGLLSEVAAGTVFEREEIASTEIGNLVAIPHPMENDTKISSVFVCILERPLLWQEQQVQIVFLISIAKDEFSVWEPLFLHLYRYLVKFNGTRKMLANPNFDYFITDFKRFIN